MSVQGNQKSWGVPRYPSGFDGIFVAAAKDKLKCSPQVCQELCISCVLLLRQGLKEPYLDFKRNYHFGHEAYESYLQRAIWREEVDVKNLGVSGLLKRSAPGSHSGCQ